MLQDNEEKLDNNEVSFIPDEAKNTPEESGDAMFVPDKKQPNLLSADINEIEKSQNAGGFMKFLTDVITADVQLQNKMEITKGELISGGVEGVAEATITQPADIAASTLQVVGDLTDSKGISEFGKEMSNTVKSFNEFIEKDWITKDESIDPKIKQISRVMGSGGGQVLQMQGIAKSLGGAFTYALYTVPDASDAYLGYRKEGYGKTEAGTAGLATGAGFYAIDRFFDGAKLMKGMKNTSVGLLDVLLEPTAEMSQEAYKNMIFKIGPDKTRDLMSGVIESGIGGLAGGIVGSASVSINGVEYNPNTNYETARQEALDAGATEEDVNNLMAEMYTNIDSNPEKVSKYLTDLANKNAEQITSMIREMPKSVAYQSVNDFYKTVDEFIKANEGTQEAERAKQTKTELDNVYKDTYSALENLMPKQEADANARLVQGHALFASQEFGVSPKEYMDTMFAKVERGGEDFLGETAQMQEPITKKMYHWTPYKFDKFKLSDNDVGIHVGTQEQANKIKEQDGRDGETKEVYIDAKNTLELEDAGMWEANSSFVSQLVDKSILTEDEANNILTTKEMSMKEKTEYLRKKIQDKGYDSIKYKNDYEEDGDYSYILFDPEQLNPVDKEGKFSGSENIYYQDESNPRGAYYRGIIHLFQNADPSTFVHESMHFYKEELMKMKDKSAKAKSILETLESFASNEFAKNYMVLAKGGRFYVADKNGRTVYDKQGKLFETGDEAREYAKDELISRGFEQYVREGKSPSKFLTRAFHSFMNWLKHIYKSAKDLGVELNDSVRQAYGDLLGGQDLDYWMGQPEEAIISEVQSVEQDRKKYLDDVINQAVKEKGTKVSEGRGRGFRDIWTRSMIPLSTRAKRVSPLLQTRLRRFEFSLANNLNKKYDLSRPFLDIWKNMSEEDAIAFDVALKNDYVEKQQELVEKYNATEQWAKIKGVLADIYTDAIGVGLELGYREDYFPRKVKDVDGFLSYMRGLEDWTRYQEALREADPENVFTPEEQAEFINKYMRGFVRVDLMPVKYGSEKQRKVPVVNNEINRFYAPSIDSYVSYIEGMNARIESAKFLGKDTENYDESIGGYLTYLQEQNLIKPNQIDEVRDILRARFGQRGVSNRFLGTARDLSYIYTMGGINSAITQIEDLSVSMYKAGVWNTLTTMFSGKEITRKDIGVENVSQEFVSQKKTSKWLNGLFKATGLDAIDGFGKETLINAIIKKYKQIYEKNPQALMDYLEPIMEDQTSSVINDILNDNKSDNLMYLVFSELSDVQPVSLSELPEFYNTAGNLRVLYMLKSFMVKRIDTFRNECFDKLKSKDTSVRIEGLQNLFRLSVLMIICGATKDWIIDLLYGRKTDMSETLVNNVLGMFGISKFHLYKAREQGFSGVLKEFVVPPLFSFWDDIIGDVFDVKEGKRKLKDLEVLKGIPLFGRFYYWWIGRGAEKQKKKRGKSRRR